MNDLFLNKMIRVSRDRPSSPPSRPHPSPPAPPSPAPPRRSPVAEAALSKPFYSQSSSSKNLTRLWSAATTAGANSLPDAMAAPVAASRHLLHGQILYRPLPLAGSEFEGGF
jgi:hypothetical protein